MGKAIMHHPNRYQVVRLFEKDEDSQFGYVGAKSGRNGGWILCNKSKRQHPRRHQHG